jgi:hypothetical protein
MELSLKFTGTVFAVLIANFLTIAFAVGALAFFKSDQGGKLLRESGFQAFFLSATPSLTSNSFRQPRLSDMQPMTLKPRPAAKPLSSTSSPRMTASSPSNGASEAAIKSSLKMCRFWNEEYREDRSAKSRAYRTLACNRYERFSGETSRSIANLAESKPTRSTYEEKLQRAEKQKEKKRIAQENRQHKAYCENLRDRIGHYDSRMRAGGSSDYLNRLRGERREVSLEYSRRCLLGQ